MSTDKKYLIPLLKKDYNALPEKDRRTFERNKNIRKHLDRKDDILQRQYAKQFDQNIDWDNAITVKVYQYTKDCTDFVLSAIAEAEYIANETVRDFLWRIHEALDSPHYRGYVDSDNCFNNDDIKYYDKEYKVKVRGNSNYTMVTNSYDTIYEVEGKFYIFGRHFSHSKIEVYDTLEDAKKVCLNLQHRNTPRRYLNRPDLMR